MPQGKKNIFGTIFYGNIPCNFVGRYPLADILWISNVPKQKSPWSWTGGSIMKQKVWIMMRNAPPI